MPDFSTAAVHQFWAEYEDPTIYHVITFMETVESFAVDENPDVDKALQALGNTLENINDLELDNEDAFIAVAAYLKTGKTLRLLQTIDTARPGAASKILIHAEETSESPDDIAGTFLRRNIAFERLRLLSRVFSADRLALVQKAIEGEDNA